MAQVSTPLVGSGTAAVSASPAGRVEERATPAILTIEGGLLLAAIAVAAILRILGLGIFPLTPDEAALAYSSWAVTHGPLPLTWPAPTYQAVTAWLLWLFGGDDVVPRLAPILAGLAVVGLTWPLRPLIGRPAALIAAWFFALSPLLSFFSRQAGAETIALALALGLTALLFRLPSRPRPPAGALGGILFAALLLAGPLGVSLALAFLCFFAIASLARERFAAVCQPVESAARTPKTLLAAIAGFVVTLVVVSTAGFFYLGGFGWTSLAAWVGLFDLRGSALPFWYQWLELLTADPAITLLGLAGAGTLVFQLVTNRWPLSGRSGSFLIWLLVWTTFGFVLAGLAPGRAADQALGPLIPLGLLAATWLFPAPAEVTAARPIRLATDRPAWGRIVRQLALIGPLLFFEAILLARLTSDQAAAGNWALWALFWAGLVLLVGFVAAPWFLDLTDGARVSATLAMIVLLAFSLPQVVRLGVRLDPVELPAGTRTSEDIHRLLGHVRWAAGHPLSGQARSIAVAESLRLPLAWYLKDYPRVQFGDTAVDSSAVVIRPSETLADGAVSSPAREAILTETWQPTFPNLARFARWLVLDRPPAAPQQQKVILHANP